MTKWDNLMQNQDNRYIVLNVTEFIKEEDPLDIIDWDAQFDQRILLTQDVNSVDDQLVIVT